MYGEGQRIDAVAAAHGLQSVIKRISARCRRDDDVAVALPDVRLAVAGFSGLGKAVDRINGKTERHGAVAAILGGEGAYMLRCACLAGRDVKAVLRVTLALADRCRQVGGLDFVDGETKFDGAVATVHGGQPVVEGIGARSCRDDDVGVTLPYVWLIFAGYGILYFVVGRMYGEGQRIDAVAAAHGLLSVVKGVGADSRRDGDVAVALPYVRFVGAGLGSLGKVVNRINGEIERHGAVTTIAGGKVELMLLCAGRGGLDVEAVLRVTLALADCAVECGDGGLMDGKVEHDYAVAAVDGRKLLLIGARGRLVEAVGGIDGAATDVRLNGFSVLMTDGKCESDNAVATVHRLAVESIGTRLGIGGEQGVAPSVRQRAGADGQRDVLVVGGVDGQGEHGGAVAARDDRRELAAFYESAGCRRGHVEAVLIVGFA